MMAADWKGLPSDLLKLVLQKLINPPVGHVRMGAVCSAWRSAALEEEEEGLIPPISKHPWLLHPTDDEEGKGTIFTFYSLCDKEYNSVYKTWVPNQLREKRYIGSSKGWLVVSDISFEIYMIHPLLGSVIPLPSPATLPEFEPQYDPEGRIAFYVWLNVPHPPENIYHYYISKVEAAYDMLLMQSLTQRRAGKVVSGNIRYADVKPVRSPTTSPMPQWLQETVKNAPVSVETPSTSNLGIQAGVYGALMIFTFASGTSTLPAGSNTGADVPGIILATGFGASLYFLTKKNINLGKATIITVGGLVVGAVVGSAVENWLQVDIVPFFGVHSPAIIVSEFILFSQFLVSLYLR